MLLHVITIQIQQQILMVCETCEDGVRWLIVDNDLDNDGDPTTVMLIMIWMMILIILYVPM